MALLKGSIVAGKYRVEDVLGSGGMGSVVAATHIELQERRALKILHHELVSHADIVERFLREARAVARLKSEHVAQVHDVGKLETGEPYIVMEYLDGMDLAKLVKERKKLPLDEAVLLIHQVCQAVEEAHSLGIVHRDLKPGNLFVTKRANGQPCMKVLDFGISKIPESKGGGRDLTKVGEIMGSPSYMAPEQIRSLKNTDARADIWALGVILYEICTGQKPFRKTQKSDVMVMVLQSNPVRPSMVRSDMPIELERVILRCLEKDPANRYANIQAFVEDLGPFLPRPAAASTWNPAAAGRAAVAHVDGLPVIPPQVVPVLPRPVVSDRSHLSVSGTAVLPPPQAGAPAFSAAPPERPAAAPAPLPPGTSRPLPWRTTERLAAVSPPSAPASGPAVTPSSRLVPIAHTPIPGSGPYGVSPSNPEAFARGWGPSAGEGPPPSGEPTASNHTTAAWVGPPPQRAPVWPIATALIIAMLGIGVAAGLYSYIRWGMPADPSGFAVPPPKGVEDRAPVDSVDEASLPEVQSQPSASAHAVQTAPAAAAGTPTAVGPTASVVPSAPFAAPAASANVAPPAGTGLAPAVAPTATSKPSPASPAATAPAATGPAKATPAAAKPPAGAKDTDLFGSPD